MVLKPSTAYAVVKWAFLFYVVYFFDIPHMTELTKKREAGYEIS